MAQDFFEFFTRNAGSVNRDAFLRKELSKYCPSYVVEDAIRNTPYAAGVPAAIIEQIMEKQARLHSMKVASISAVCGLSSSPLTAGAATIGDGCQYHWHLFVYVQEVGYLTGLKDLSSDLSSSELLKLIFLFGIGACGQGFKDKAGKTIGHVCGTSIKKLLQELAKQIGVNIAKRQVKRVLNKVLPVIGVVLSGGSSYLWFKASANAVAGYAMKHFWGRDDGMMVSISQI